MYSIKNWPLIKRFLCLCSDIGDFVRAIVRNVSSALNFRCMRVLACRNLYHVVCGTNYESLIAIHSNQRNYLRPDAPLRKIPPGREGVEPVPKEKPKVNIGEVIRSYRGQRGLSQGDIERRTGLLRCYLSRVENGHTVPSLETLAKIAEAMEIALADFFPGAETPRDRDTQKMLGELSEDEIRFLSEIKKYSTTLSDGDKRLVLAMIRKMATVIPPPPPRKIAARRTAY